MSRPRALTRSTSERTTNPVPELTTRVASALVLAALAIGAALISPLTFLLLVIAASCVIAWEWGRLTRGDGSDRIAIVQMIGVALALTLVAFGRPALALGALGLTALAIAAASAGTQSLPWALAGLAYAAFPGAALIWLRSDAALGAVAVLYLLAVASTTDTVAYATGRLIGGPKLAPRISPHKTLSGFAAGLLGPALVGVAAAAYLGGTTAAWLAFVSVALAPPPGRAASSRPESSRPASPEPAPSGVLAPSTPLAAAFARATSTAFPSSSSAITGAKPSFAAATASTPEPQPTSTSPPGSSSRSSSRLSRLVA